ADRPELVNRVGPAERARLLATSRSQIAARGPDYDQNQMLPLALVLARLRDSEATRLLSENRHRWAEAQRLIAVTRFESESDPARLADAIDHGQGEKDPDRIAALERCERVRGLKLYGLISYCDGVADYFWPKLAQACRSGVPHKW